MLQGKILEKNGNVFVVYNDEKTYNCTPKGNIKLQRIKPFVGDNVIFDEDKLTIEKILDRENTLLRPSLANLDYGIIITSLKEPSYSKELLNMFISFLNIYEVEPMIIFTKVDLLDNKEEILEIKKHYEVLNYKCFIKDEENEDILNELKGKTVAFLGQTGAGKSTFINTLLPFVNQKIGEYSKSLKRGKHQTTSIKLIPYKSSFIADTPGFSSIELHCFKEEFASYYLNYKHFASSCKFNNCLHVNEDGCKVKANILTNEDELDYQIYLKLLKKLSYRKDRYSK